MPLNSKHDDESFWQILPTMHRELTANQWNVLRRHAEGHSAKRIAADLGVGRKAVATTLKRAGNHIFDGTPFDSGAGAMAASTSRSRRNASA